MEKDKLISCGWEDENGNQCYWLDNGYCLNPTVINSKDCKDSGYVEYIQIND